jgi:nucleoside-diphosphate-sugar epimerase
MKLRADQCILVTGAEGFIGKDVSRRLLEYGWRVKAMSHRAGSTSFESNERLELVHADMRDECSLRQAIAGVAVVVHLAAAKSDEPESDDVNVRGAERLVKMCQTEGCCRVINISTQSAEIAQKGKYASTKSAAEKVFHNSGLQVTTLRPSVVYGEEEGGVFGTVLKCVRRLPVVPVLGDGNWLSAPVYVGDVSKAIIACIESDNTTGRIYSVGGPECIKFDAVIDRICCALGVRRRKFHIPFGLSLWAARILVALWPKCPITVSNVLGSNQNTEVDIEPARKDFGFDPLSLDEGLELVLGYSGCGSSNDSDQRIAADFKLIAGYLIDPDPPPPVEMVDRYVIAHRMLLGDVVASEWEFVRQHPRALPYLDAAAGVLARQSLLRKKILIAAAILESSPAYAEFFLAEVEGRIRLLGLLAWHGALSVGKLALGAPLLLAVRRK